MRLKSPTTLARGIRSSYDLVHIDADCTNIDPGGFARVREIAVPAAVVVDRATGVLRAVYAKGRP